MKNPTRGILAVMGTAFVALCLATPAPASAADGDPVVVMVQAPSYTCVPGPANDEIGDPKVISGADIVDAVVELAWHMAPDGSIVRVGEVYPQPDAPNWVFASDSWQGQTYTDDGGDCGQAPALIVIPIPSAPATSPDDPSKEGDVQWVGFEDSAQYIYGYNADGELLVSAADGYILEGNVTDFNYGFPPDVYNPPTTPTDPTTPPGNGGGAGDDGSNGGGDDNGGSTPPASTPDTSTPSTGGQTSTSGSDDKSSADTSKDGTKSTATKQVRRPGHNGAVAASDSSLGFGGWSALAFVLTLAAGGGYLVRRKRAGTI